MLQARHRLGSLHHELRVRREVVEGHTFARGAHLLGDGPEPRRAIEVVDPQRLGPSAGLEPGGAIPAGGFADGGTGRSLLRQQRRAAHPTSVLVLQRGPVHRVQPPEGFVRLVVQPRPVVRPATHARDVDLGQVLRRVTLDDPLRERQPDPGPEDDPLRVQPRRHEQVLHLGELADVEVGVGREALGGSQVVLEAGVAQRRQPLARGGEHRREVIPVLAELGESVGRHVAGRLGLALRLERPHHQRSAVVPHIEVAVEIAQEREPFLRTVDGLRHDPHVLGRVERDRRAREPGKLRGPEPGGEDDRVRFDRPPVGLDPGHRAVLDAKPGDRHAEREHGAAIVRPLGERQGRIPGVHGGVGGHEQRPDQVVDLRDRPRVAHLRRLQDAGLDVELAVHVRGAPELLHPPRRPRQGERTDAAEPGLDAGLGRQPRVERRVDARQLGQRVRPPDLGDQAGRVPGRAAGQARPLHDEHVGDAELREVVGDRGADHAAADDHDPGARRRLRDGFQDRRIEVAVCQMFRDRHVPEGYPSALEPSPPIAARNISTSARPEEPSGSLSGL